MFNNATNDYNYHVHRQETGNVILLKDLSNIASASKRGKSRNDIDVTVDTLMKHYGKY